MIEAAALAFRVAEQIDVDAILAALEVEVDQSACAAAAAGARGEQRLVRADLLAHDDDLVPLAGGRTIARRFQALRGLQEGVLVAPDEIDFQQFEAQIAPLGLALERDAHQIGRLIVQAVRHVKIGLGQRIALIEIDGALARHGVIGADFSSPVSPNRPVSAVKSGTGCWPDSSTTKESLPLRIALSLAAASSRSVDVGLVHQRAEVIAAGGLAALLQAANPSTRQTPRGAARPAATSWRLPNRSTIRTRSAAQPPVSSSRAAGRAPVSEAAESRSLQAAGPAERPQSAAAGGTAAGGTAAGGTAAGGSTGFGGATATGGGATVCAGGGGVAGTPSLCCSAAEFGVADVDQTLRFRELPFQILDAILQRLVASALAALELPLPELSPAGARRHETQMAARCRGGGAAATLRQASICRCTSPIASF